ncbi:MAG: class I SAM-dependent methyltransferase [Polyangiaceae bacterium]
MIEEHQAAALRSLERRYMGEGQLILPAVPALLDRYVEIVAAHFGNLSRALLPEGRSALRKLLAEKLAEAYSGAPQSNVFIRYKVERGPGGGVSYAIASAKSTLPEEYDHWVSTRVGTLFGGHPDAKVMAVARSLGPAAAAKGLRALDVGAGTGRNTLPLARAGFRAVALELSGALADVLADELDKEALDVQVICGDVLDAALVVPHAPFDLCVVAEVIPHLRTEAELRALFERLSGLLAPGGILVASAFLTKEGCSPDVLTRQIAEVLWSAYFTREELGRALDGLPFTPLSDEPALAYEKEHLPPHAWPPTSWYVSWASGGDAFDTAPGEAPIELRWLCYRRNE